MIYQLHKKNINKLVKIFTIVSTFSGMTYSTFAITAIQQNTIASNGLKFNEYLKIIESDKKNLGNSQNGEIEILNSKNEIKEIQEKRKQYFLKKGFSLDEANSFSKVGIVAEDPYWYWLRDAIKTDRGTGTYNRLFWKSSLDGSPGVAMLPILPNGKFLFISAYRHATRSWELELSRGGREKGENDNDTAKRELQEETGYQIIKEMEKDSIQFLGNMAPDAGTISSVVPVYLIKNLEKKKKSIENTEAINSNISLSCKEVLDAIKSGYYEYLDANKKKRKLYVRDAFISYAVLQYTINYPKNNCFQ